MTSPPEDTGAPVGPLSDRALWQLCQRVDAPEDESRRLLDLAAFAEGGLDPDEQDRIAALLLADPIAAADVAATRAAGNRRESSATIARIAARASALRPGIPARSGRVLLFSHARQHLLLHGLAQWGSLAAGLAMAAWLGFTMGSAASLALSQTTISGEDGTVIELFDPATGFLHDLTAGVQT
jgi:anti-sigma factor RsiW